MQLLERFGIAGQVAVVTGGGRGIGEGIALGLAEAGADVVLAARRTAEIEAVAEKVRKLGRRARRDDRPERQWGFQLDLNLKAVWTGAQAAARIMKDHGGGRIINISSSAAGNVAPHNGPYAVAKSGVNNPTQTLAVELAPLGIRVNGVSPGPIPTEVFLEFTKMTGQTIVIRGGP